MPVNIAFRMVLRFLLLAILWQACAGKDTAGSILPLKSVQRADTQHGIIHFKQHLQPASKAKQVVVGHSKRTARNAIVDSSRLWPDGRIPFVFDSNVPAFSKVEILAAMQEIESSVYSTGLSCVTFIPRQSEPDYLHISWTSANHGSTSIGKNGGRQELLINTLGGRGHDDNLNILMIVLGLFPEAMRSDRDQYLNIDLTNIRAPQAFQKLSGATTDYFGQTFDYSSLLLYTPYQYSADPSKPVMTAKQANQVMGQSVSLSSGDVTLLQHTYKCQIDSSNRVNILTNSVVSCHFHTGFCNLVQDQRDNFDWVLSKGPRQNSGTGPNADYSSGSGNFALARSSGHANQIATLTTPTLTAGEYCLRVNLYMYGSAMGRLDIIATHSTGDVKVLSQAGELGNEWYHSYIEINSKADFTLQFQATIGDGVQSDIALDDIYVYNGLCIEWN